MAQRMAIRGMMANPLYRKALGAARKDKEEEERGEGLKAMVINDVLEGSYLKEQPIIKDIPSFQNDMRDPEVQRLT